MNSGHFYFLTDQYFIDLPKPINFMQSMIVKSPDTADVIL